MNVIVQTSNITDWKTFHEEFQRVFRFPDYYGNNMNAWVDCMTDYIEEHIENQRQSLIIELENRFEFEKRCPEQYQALVECVEFVNDRFKNKKLVIE